MIIENGSTVVLHYTGKLENGDVFDTSVGGEPITVELGTTPLIKGFQDGLIGKTLGESVITIASEEAYGPVREDLFIKYEKAQMPGEVTEGMVLETMLESGQSIQVKVKEVLDDSVIIDANHFLAGMDLTFELNVIEVK